MKIVIAFSTWVFKCSIVYFICYLIIMQYIESYHSYFNYFFTERLNRWKNWQKTTFCFSHLDSGHLHVFDGRLNGRFQSPGFPPTSVGYPAGVSYGWLITSGDSPRADITITFDEFSLEDALRCVQADFVVVYKGEEQGVNNLTWTQVCDLFV